MCRLMFLMAQWGLMFGDVISKMRNSRIPIVTELILIILAADPVEAYVQGFGEFGDNGIICDPGRGQVVCLEG